MTTRDRVLRLLLVAGVLIVAVASDQWAYEHLVYRRIYDGDLGRMLRVVGYLPLWGIVAAALYLHERRIALDARRRALLLVGSPVVAGIAAELLKLLLRRERPEVAAGLYSWRAFTERTFSTSGLALPSSHTMVAFGAAWMLCRLFPRARWVWISLAVGCGLSRVLAHAHFVSDVTVAALAAWATTAWLWRRFGAPVRVSGERTTVSGHALSPESLS
jgi:membrane-associated phospholipid phosphatase